VLSFSPSSGFPVAGTVAVLNTNGALALRLLTGTGASADNSFTKSNSSTIDTVWSDTPVNATTNASSSSSGAAQTAKISPFSQTQSGHGTDIVNSCDVVKAVKTVFVGKRGSGAGCNVSHRRYVNGARTDTLIGALAGTTDAYYESDSFTTTPANLDLLEAGVVRDSCTSQTTTVEDVWVSVAYVPTACSAGTRKRVWVNQ
jgi:hypothetical protein